MRVPQIRLYVLQGYSLAGKDDDNLSDPYLIVRFGEQEVSTRERKKRNTRDPKFFEYFEFQSLLPGVNDILVTVKDHNTIHRDELIGSTVIDLEDRYCTIRYDALCTNNLLDKEVCD